MLLLFTRSTRRLLRLRGGSRLEASRRLAHPIDLLHELPVEPSQTTRHLAFFRRALSRERGNVPQRMVRDVAREANQGTGGSRPVREGRSVRADDALWELGHDWVGEFLGAPLPDVRPAVRGG